jgi:uncharacterized protein (TIGR00255 family)
MALSGMTGFSREDAGHGAWTWAVEARSVNGRNLEARFRGPPGFDSLDRAARDGAQARFQRGQITIGLQAKRADPSAQVRLNTDQLDRYLAIAAPYVAAGQAGPPSMDGLLALRGVIEVAEESDDPEARAELEAAMTMSIERALDGLKTSRLEEGLALTPVLLGLIEKIERLVAEAALQAQAQTSLVKERFQRRVGELMADVAGLEERILQEAAVLAAKADVQEEIDRLSNHVEAARSLIGGEAAAGRRLDFLTQEFMREANTLCAKSATNALTTTGLELKAVVEQLREQVQNVE